MMRINPSLIVNNLPRFGSTAAVSKKVQNLPDVFSEASADGIKMTCITSPTPNTGLSRIVAVFKSGSRNEEKSVDRGLAHLIRRSFGLSTEQYTAVNLTRHLEQIGARVNVMGTREHTIYTVDCAPNLASRAGYLLTHMASAGAFYNWELKDVAYKLMSHDIDCLQRRDLANLCLDLLHEAAFGNHPEGTRLGRSLYATHDRLGSYSYEQITDFLKRSVSPGNCAITLMNLGDHHKHMDPSKAFQEIKSGLNFHPPHHGTVAAPKHDFVGGEIRRDLANSSSTHAMVAYHVPGGKGQKIAMGIAAHALQGGVHNISYADAGSRASRLAKTADAAGGFDDYLTQVGAMFHGYSDHGMFGYTVVGACGRATGARVSAVSKLFGELCKTGLSAEEVQRGKALLKAEMAARAENMQERAVEVSLQVLETGKIHSHEEMAAEVDKMNPDTVNQALKQVLGSGKMALSVVGANTALTPPLALLRH